MSEVGTIPQSNALTEAKPESISEFLSRNPLELGPEDRKKMVGILREQRGRWEKAEAAGEHKRAPKGTSKMAVSLETTKTAEDLGL